jgi:hypothetical protein
MTGIVDPDTDGPVDFLEHWAPGGPWVLSAIEPDGPIETRTFRDRQATKAWIETWQGKRNIYFSVNTPKSDLKKKATKADIGALNAFHVDLDNPDGADPEQTKTAILLPRLKNYRLPPSVIIDSGGGLQGFWRMREPVALNDPASIEQLEAYNRQLETDLGGDYCHNIDRIMRLPGTINLPNRKKRLAGREAAPARVVEADWDRRYRLEEFALPPTSDAAHAGPGKPNGHDTEALASEVDIDALPVSKRIRNLIRGIHDPEHHYQSRSEAVMAVLVAMAAKGCADEQITAVVFDERFPDGAHVRERKEPNAYLARQIAKARKLASDPELFELNQSYALILVGGQAVILKEGISAEGKPGFDLISLSAFNHWLENRFLETSSTKIPLAKHWLRHPDRRQYEGLVFLPGRKEPRYYNLWRGFSVQPRLGSCQLFLDHLFYNVCQGEVALYLWIVGWFADLFQNPGNKCGTSVVIRGKMGTGKTIVGKIIGSLLGDHYVVVSDPRYVTGRFNSHLVSCLLLHADEGFWAGDRAAEGKLKDLVTGGEHFIELKGKEPIRVRNFIRLLVTGNPDWIVPAGMEERRFAVFECGEDHIQDHPYFAGIEREMDNGGREALLDYLLRHDLSKVDLGEIPKTDALLDQKIASLPPEKGWWLDVLQSGRLPSGSGGAECPAALMFDHYIRHANNTGARRRSIETQIGIFLKRVVPELRKYEGKYKGYEGRDEVGLIYGFPELAKCREKFASMIQHPLNWGEPFQWLKDP